MNQEQLLPQEQPVSSVKTDLSFLKKTKIFDIASSSVISFDELIKTSSVELNIEYEFFFSNSLGTQWGYMKIVGGKPVKTIPLLEINVISVAKVNSNGLSTEGYLVKYCQNVMRNITDEYIPDTDVKNNKLISHFSLPPQVSKNKDDLCNRLLKNIIFSKIGEGENELRIDIGNVQGWNYITKNKAIFETKNRYPESLYSVLPNSILERERPKIRQRSDEHRRKCQEEFYSFFGINTWHKTMYLLRISSYNLTFSHKLRADFNQIINISPSETVTSSMLIAILKNDSFTSNDVLTLGGRTKSIEKCIAQRNDGILLVVDETKADESERRKGNIELLESAVISKAKDNNFIPIIISKYAAHQIRTDFCCSLSIGDFKCTLEQNYVKYILGWNDANFLKKVEENFQDFSEVYRQNFTEVSLTIPESVPPHRRQVYIILVTAARTYDEFYDYFFGKKVERFIVDWLSDYNEIGSCIDDEILKDFGICLNQEISNGIFHYIKRTKYIVFNKETNSAIVDENCIYIETANIKDLVKNKMKCIHSVDSLTDILKESGYLEINDRNSKCYRFQVQNSDGEPYKLYTYGISLKLINSENRKRLSLADKEKFLQTYEELKESNILPLGTTPDGKYVGKDISFKNKSNNSIFITGSSGKGKTFCASNILPSLAMLGSREVVFDVSRSFTREELLRALPAEVIDALFEFIEVGEKKGKIPINPLRIADCIGISEKKRRVFGLVSAAAGKLDKGVSRTVKSVISDMLKKNANASNVSIKRLSSTLENGGKEVKKVYDLISSALDDMERIGCAEQGWSELFENSKKVIIISLGDEVDDNVHSLLDMLVSSLFEWQRDHDTSPLTIVVDEIKYQNFAVGSPLNTIITQGRKFGTKLIGLTQEYISKDRNIDIMKEAGIKFLFEPAKSRDRIAAELGYKSGIDAGFGTMKCGEFILVSDCYNKIDGVNEPTIIHGSTVNFVDTPLYEKFKEMFGNREM